MDSSILGVLKLPKAGIHDMYFFLVSIDNNNCLITLYWYFFPVSDKLETRLSKKKQYIFFHFIDNFETIEAIQKNN